MKNRIIILELLIIFTMVSRTQAQELKQKDPFEIYLNGNIITKPQINAYLGEWRSDGGKYVFRISKSTEKFKNSTVDFRTDVLILKLIKSTDKLKSADKIINQPFMFLTVFENYADVLYQDPTTQNEGTLKLKFLNNNVLEMTISNRWIESRTKGYFFPPRIVLNRLQ